MISSGKGLVVGKDGYFTVEFTRGQLVLDLDDVDATAKLNALTAFVPTVAQVGSTTKWGVTIPLAELTAAGDLVVEFTLTKTGETINPNAKPLIIPVRALYAEAS